LRDEHGVTVTLSDGPSPAMSRERRIVVFEAVREFLFNAAKHAEVAEVRVDVHDREDGFEVVVTDEGIGFDPSGLDGNGSYGLASARQRVQFHGGRLDIASEPGSGTRVSIYMPTSVD
jgi:signal transduction histidine kinase